MDIKQLLTMITLSQTLNYQKAAEQLQYAPSTLFKHIQMLEQEVGAPLFCKTGRQLALTRQGEAFLAHATRMVEHYYLALDSVCPAEKLEGYGCFRVAMYLMPEAAHELSWIFIILTTISVEIGRAHV